MAETLFNFIKDDDLDVLNVELGAGSGKFGEKFHSRCYLTDKDERYKKFVDFLCSAEYLPWPENRFNLVILCNPFNYGFIESQSGVNLMKEFCRVLKQKGQILIISLIFPR